MKLPTHTSHFVQLAQARAHRKLRIVLPGVPRRLLSVTDRALAATLHAAEFATWQASGGDALRRTGPG